MRIGIDLGGTKIEGIVMGPGSEILERQRAPTHNDDYSGQIDAIAQLAARLQDPVAGAGCPA